MAVAILKTKFRIGVLSILILLGICLLVSNIKLRRGTEINANGKGLSSIRMHTLLAKHVRNERSAQKINSKNKRITKSKPKSKKRRRGKRKRKMRRKKMKTKKNIKPNKKRLKKNNRPLKILPPVSKQDIGNEKKEEENTDEIDKSKNIIKTNKVKKKTNNKVQEIKVDKPSNTSVSESSRILSKKLEKNKNANNTLKADSMDEKEKKKTKKKKSKELKKEPSKNKKDSGKSKGQYQCDSCFISMILPIMVSQLHIGLPFN